MNLKDVSNALAPIIEAEGLPPFDRLRTVTFDAGRPRATATFVYHDTAKLNGDLVVVTKSYQVPMERA